MEKLIESVKSAKNRYLDTASNQTRKFVYCLIMFGTIAGCDAGKQENRIVRKVEKIQVTETKKDDTIPWELGMIAGGAVGAVTTDEFNGMNKPKEVKADAYKITLSDGSTFVTTRKYNYGDKVER